MTPTPTQIATEAAEHIRLNNEMVRGGLRHAPHHRVPHPLRRRHLQFLKRTMNKNPARDRYIPPTGYVVGQQVTVTRKKSTRVGIVTGFGNPEVNKEPSIRVRFPHYTSKQSITVPITSIHEQPNRTARSA